MLGRLKQGTGNARSVASIQQSTAMFTVIHSFPMEMDGGQTDSGNGGSNAKTVATLRPIVWLLLLPASCKVGDYKAILGHAWSRVCCHLLSA
jgi:hypothetical protein